MSTHRIDARIPNDLYRELRKTKQRTSEVVVCALENYLHTNSTQPHTKSTQDYTQDPYVKQILSENEYLRGSFSKLLNRAVLPPSEGNEGTFQAVLEPSTTVIDIDSPKPKTPTRRVKTHTRTITKDTKKQKKKKEGWFTRVSRLLSNKR